MSDNISEAINKLVKNNPDRCIVGTVKAVNGILCDVTPIDGTADLIGVRLCTEDTATVFVIIPVVGSVVYVTMDSDTGGIVTGFSEVDEMYLRGDTHNGLVKVADLTTRLNIIENSFNAFVIAFNALVTVYSAHFHITGGPPPLVPGVPFTTVLTPTVQTQIENLKVKHG